MIEEFKYEELIEMSKSLASSSKNIRNIVEKYPKDLAKIFDFCSSVDSYASFIDSSIILYQDSEKALEGIMKKINR